MMGLKLLCGDWVKVKGLDFTDEHANNSLLFHEASFLLSLYHLQPLGLAQCGVRDSRSAVEPED
jgi:hypothetical protein